MQVTSGAEWATSGGGRRSYALSLDLDDLREMRGEDKVAGLDRKQCLSELNKAAEILVLAYVAQEGGISKELAQSRIAEIKNGT